MTTTDKGTPEFRILQPPDYNQTIAFYTAAGNTFTIHPDGRIERGPAFTTDDAESLQFWTIICKAFPFFREAVSKEAITTLSAERDEWKECAETQMRGHGETQRELDAVKAERDAMKVLLEEACSSVENQANWDKPPYSKWYYRARAALQKAGA